MLQREDIDRITEVIQRSAQPFESVEDIVSAGIVLGEQRAQLLHREIEPEDIMFGLSILCRWPLKPPPLAENRHYLQAYRSLLFAGASSDQNVRDQLIQVVPTEVLTLQTNQLYNLLQTLPVQNTFQFHTTINKSLVRGLYEEGWNQGNLNIIDMRLGNSQLWNTPWGQLTTMFRDVFPGSQVIIEDLIAEGNEVATRWRLQGMQQGELKGILPTGKEVTVTGTDTFRIEQGKIVEARTSFDQLDLLRQLGMVIPPKENEGEI